MRRSARRLRRTRRLFYKQTRVGQLQIDVTAVTDRAEAGNDAENKQRALLQDAATAAFAASGVCAG